MDTYRTTHAGLTANTLIKLPSFSEASVDEILDIRRTLSKPLVNFRSKMLVLSESLHTMPWDSDFSKECEILFSRDILPSIMEIDEITSSTTFIKNLGKNNRQ